MDRIAWSELEHNYGDAADIPQHLRACADQDAAAAGDALGEVYNLLYHQGGWICPAASAALPFLLDLACGTARHHRHEIVELIGRLAREATTVERRFLDAGWQPALDTARPRILALLDDPDPRVRREATLLVADGIRHPDAVRALRRRWEVETDRVTRWDLVLALGVVCARQPADEPLRAALLPLLTHDDLQIRLAAVHALTGSEPGAAVSHVDTLVRAVLHDDAAGWQESAWIGGNRSTIIHSTGALMRPDPVAATAYTIGISRGGDTDQLVATMDEAGRVLTEWRTVTGAILPFLADHLDHAASEVRYRAAYLLACLGTEATAFADQLATLAADSALRDSRKQVTVGDAAVWALARQHDPRCLPGLIERLTSRRLGFDTAASHFGRDAFVLWQPGIDEVLIPLHEHTEILIGAVATRLAAARDDKALASSLCRVIEQWGPSAEAALPAVAPLLETGDKHLFGTAARALGGIGPAGAAFAGTLRRRSGEPDAAWALWRTGADLELGKDMLVRHVVEHRGQHHGIRLLADLGSEAASCTDLLRQVMHAGDDWARVEAAHTLWRVSGDPGGPAAVLTDVARPLAEGTGLPVRLAAMRYLAAIGTTIELATGIAQAVLDNPRRIAYFGGWRAFTEDEDLRTAAARLLVPRQGRADGCP